MRMSCPLSRRERALLRSMRSGHLGSVPGKLGMGEREALKGITSPALARDLSVQDARMPWAHGRAARASSRRGEDTDAGRAPARARLTPHSFDFFAALCGQPFRALFLAHELPNFPHELFSILRELRSANAWYQCKLRKRGHASL